MQLREFSGREVPSGLFDLDRKPMLVAQAFQDLCSRHADETLMQSFCEIGFPEEICGRT